MFVGHPWGSITTKVDYTSFDVRVTTKAEQMPQNPMANQQFYIQVVKKIYENTWTGNTVEPRVTFASRRVCVKTTHPGTNQFVYLFQPKNKTLSNMLCT
jgi:hypothetical protein